MKSSKIFKMFMFCLLMAILVCSFGTVNAANVAFSPPDVSNVLTAAVPIMAMAAIAIPANVADYFKRYPTSDEVFSAGDKLFHNSGSAQSYAALQKDGKIEHYTRAQVSQQESGDITNDQENAIELLKSTDLSTLNQASLLKIAKTLELTTADNKKETLFAALEKYKSELTEQ